MGGVCSRRSFFVNCDISPASHPPRWSDRAAPVPDGKQEGGQHVLHDLVHQLVLNWSQRSSSVEPAQMLHSGVV